MRLSHLACGLSLMACTAIPCTAQEHKDAPTMGMMHLSARFRNLLRPEELRGTCGGLTMTLHFHVERMKLLKASADKDGEQAGWSLFGGSESLQGYALEHERVQALNAFLDAKGCQTVNVEEALRNAPAAEKSSSTRGKGKAGERH